MLKLIKNLSSVVATLAIVLASQSLLAAEPVITGVGKTTITWTPPTQNLDGTPTTITNYVLFWGNASRFGRCPNAAATNPGPDVPTKTSDAPASATDKTCYPNTLLIAPGSSSHAFSIPVNGSTSMSFAMAAIGNGGLISQYSNEVRKTLTVTTTSGPKPPKVLSVDILVDCTTDTEGVACEFNVR
jgi:hypothetical protein